MVNQNDSPLIIESKKNSIPNEKKIKSEKKLIIVIVIIILIIILVLYKFFYKKEKGILTKKERNLLKNYNNQEEKHQKQIKIIFENMNCNCFFFFFQRKSKIYEDTKDIVLKIFLQKDGLIKTCERINNTVSIDFLDRGFMNN